MICPNCATPNDSESMFCLQCGTALQNPNQMPTIQSNSTVSGILSQVSNTASSESNGDALIGHEIDGRYRINAVLGVGGMGTVYRGIRLSIGDEVAIKILHPDQVKVPQAAERFRREAQAAARLKHMNAVTVYDFGVSHEGLFYLVMELVEGESVRNLIKQRGPFTPSAAADVMTQVCAALDEAHRQSIVHRDIKPDNIMVQASAGGLRVKVLDFGIAKLRDQAASNLTQTGSVMGTPHYMSPEQCIGEELDSRSDIYSLGVVLYEMLAGVVPFNSPTSTAVVVQHVNQPPPPLRAMNLSISPAVEAVVMHALEKRREARPQTAGAFAHELNEAVNISSSRQATLHMPANSAPLAAGTGHLTSPVGQPTMVLPATAPSGSRAAMTAGASQYAGGPAQTHSSNKLLFIILSILAVAAIGALAYIFLLRHDSQESALPDHFGIFARNKDALSELRREEFHDVMQARDAIVGESSLPRVDAKPTLILFSEGQDIPVSDLKLVQLDSIDSSGKMNYWNYQVAPVEGHSGMKQIKIAGGLGSGKYAFALLNGYMDEGNHKFWPFQVKEDAPAPADAPQVATLQLKPKPSPTQLPKEMAQMPLPAAAPQPIAPPTGARVAYCTENNVVLRGAPNLDGPKVGRLSSGQRLYILEVSSNYDTWRGFTANWAYVQPEGSLNRGWVFTHFVRY